MTFKELIKDFLDLIFPRCCECCDQVLVGNEHIICTACLIALPRVRDSAMISSTMPYRFAHVDHIESIHSFLVFTKKGKVQKLLHALKYRGQEEVGLLLGKMFGQEMADINQLPDAELILSVPLHSKKRKSRGYNQSDLLAAGFSEATGIPWTGNALKRVKYTETQTGKNKQERRRNVENVFEIGEKFSAKSLILIDDVLTTGATLEECVRVLAQNGCERFHILTIALAQH